jgi:hypothetical protein
MSACDCGRSLGADSDVCERCAALRSLGLGPNATEAEIKDAYRTLAKVWHPDRFQADPGLKAKAEEKLKEINAAYRSITTTLTEASAAKFPNAPASNATPSPPQPSAGDFVPSRARRQPHRMRLAISVAILLVGGAWLILRYGRPEASQSITSMVTEDSAAQPVANPVKHEARTQTTESGPGAANLNQTATKNTQLPDETPNDSATLIQPAKAKTRTHSPAPASSLVVYPPDNPRVPYFTVGSTKDDVIRVQGIPSRVTNDLFAYGLSEVYFKDGRVQSWRMDPSSPLKAWAPEQ